MKEERGEKKSKERTLGDKWMTSKGGDERKEDGQRRGKESGWRKDEGGREETWRRG